jgi:serine/threonine protein kinase
MSPEQVRGHDVDHTTDIFACGAILYEMLAGRRAFHGRFGGGHDERDPQSRSRGVHVESPLRLYGIGWGEVLQLSRCNQH